MYDLVGQEYECPACGRKEPWRAESAGRPVTCACGAALTVPFHPGHAETRSPGPTPATPAPGQFAEVEIEESETPPPDEMVLCPDCGGSMRPGAIVCTQCGYHRARPKKRVFRRRGESAESAADGNGAYVAEAPLRPPRDEWTALGIRPVQDQWIPLGLAAVGIIIQIILLGHVFNPPLTLDEELSIAPLLLLLAAGTVGVGLLVGIILTPVLDLFLGPIGPMAMKMAAAVLFPASIGSLIYFACGSGATGIAVGWIASIMLYLALFRILFEFDWPDAVLLTALVCLAHALILGSVVWPLASGRLPLPELWDLFKPIIAQSILTFVIAGVLVLPHFKEP